MLQGVEVRPPETLAGMDQKPATILIVEDHPTTRRFLADNLAADGYEPLEADSAREGRRLMAALCAEYVLKFHADGDPSAD